MSSQDERNEQYAQAVRNGKALAYGNLVEMGMMSPAEAKTALAALLAEGPSERAKELLLKLPQERPQ